MSRPLSWGALIAWCAAIFLVSHQPNLGTDLGALDVVLRKTAHLLEFGVLTLLAAWAFSTPGRPWFARATLATAVTFAVLYAVSDEWHQRYVDGRVGSPTDVGIDTLGAVVAAVGARRVARRRMHRRDEVRRG